MSGEFLEAGGDADEAICMGVVSYDPIVRNASHHNIRLPFLRLGLTRKNLARHSHQNQSDDWMEEDLPKNARLSAYIQ